MRSRPGARYPLTAIHPLTALCPLTALYLLMVAASLLATVPAHAQADLEAERNSLEGVTSFALRLTVEAPRELSGSGALSTAALAESVIEQLRAAGLPVTSREDAQSYLHVHVNTMSLENGLVPFAIEANFYQPVRLQTSAGGETTAATWGESVLGLVTRDRLPTIAGSVEQLVDQFARDFEIVN